jgi:uncharacterized alpha-E superfamily protein
MTAIEHALLATFFLWVFFQVGRYLGRKDSTVPALSAMFDKLERHGFIVTKTNDKGEKELQKVIDTVL